MAVAPDRRRSAPEQQAQTLPVAPAARADTYANDGRRIVTRWGTSLRARPWRPGAFSTLRPRSRKQSQRDRDLARLKREIVAERGPWCEMCRVLARHRGVSATHAVFASDGCDGIGMDLHHLLPRSLGGRDVKPNLMLAGRGHHDWCERAENRDEAIAAGILRVTPPAAHVRHVGVPYDLEEES